MVLKVTPKENFERERVSDRMRGREKKRKGEEGERNGGRNRGEDESVNKV